MTDPTPAEAIEGRAQEMLQSLIGNHYSDTTLRVATDWLRQERRLALSPPDAGEVRTYREGVREPTPDDIERVALAIELAWDESDELPPVVFTPGEREYLARAAYAAAIRKLP